MAAADFSFTLPSISSRSRILNWSGATYKSSDGEEYSVTINSSVDLLIKWKTVSSKLIKIQRYRTGGSDFSYTKTFLVHKAQSYTIPHSNLRDANYYNDNIAGTLEITISPHINFDASTKIPDVTKPVLKQEPVMEKKLDHLSSDMKNLLNTGNLSDIVLTDGKTEIHAHKVILSLRSKVFAKMLAHPMKEKLENQITIEDISIPVLKDLLHFMYSGTILIKDAKMARDLYIASDKYAVKELRNICSEVLKKVNLNNVLDTLLLSDLLNDTALKNAALNFVSQNYSEVKALEDWNNFIKVNQALAIEILSFVIDKKN